MGIWITKSRIIALTLVVIALIIAEGLIIGLVGRTECQARAPIEENLRTSSPAKTTRSTTTTTASSTVEDQETGPWTNYRLPLDLIPIEYDVSLRPILEPSSWGEYIFRGTSKVIYVCQEPTRYIVLHSWLLDYNLSDWKLLNEDGTEISLLSMQFYDENNFVVLKTEASCEKGASYELTLSDFTGQLRNDIFGFYRRNYVNGSGVSRVIAASQMQATGARKTFPCFDEPFFKATFRITLWHKTGDNYFSLSNMPVDSYQISVIDSEEWTGTVFQRTVRMPTYLLAMVTNVYARPEFVAAGEADYAAVMTPHILDFLQNYVGIPYSLSKSDQVSVPDFRGGMENWGLVIYGDSYLMYNNDASSDRKKIRTTNIIAHELAHQWFGNLVSCEWWDNLWLNEGFATYYSYVAEADAQPTWKAQERFTLSETRLAFKVDELTSSKPIIREVNSDAAIYAMIDDITYSKGGSILRMINGFMGEENFVNGTRDYLLDRQYDVANQNQLFSYWDKMGFPVVNVRDRDPLTNTFRVSQEYYLRYLEDEPIPTPGSVKYGYKWYIPFTFKRGSNLAKEEELVWISPDQTVSLTETEFILGNVRANGYYRVNYDRDSWDRIVARLDSQFYKDIPEENRAQLLDDAFTFACSGRLDPIVVLRMLEYLQRDDSYIAWKTFFEDIKCFEYMLGRTEVYGTFKNYILELVVPSLYNPYGWEDGPRTDEKLIERMTRAIAIDAACFYGYSDCINTATQYFSDWMTSPDDWTIIPINIRSGIICSAIRSGGIEEWNFAWERHKVAISTEWSSSLKYGMACSKDPWILNRYLEYALDPTLIGTQDALTTMQLIGDTDYGYGIVWAFLVNNWDHLLEKFETSVSLSGLINSITKRFSTEYELKLLEDFKENTTDLGELAETVKLSIMSTQANIRWRIENEDNLAKWLYDNVDNIV